MKGTHSTKDKTTFSGQYISSTPPKKIKKWTRERETERDSKRYDQLNSFLSSITRLDFRMDNVKKTDK
ncbi:hypothetical protein LguiA_006545 [Lonicera macranthoides]